MKKNLIMSRGVSLGILISLLLGAGVIVPTTSATTVRDVWSDGHGAYPTIQAAINAANNGDTVLLHVGTYHQHCISINKPIHLQGQNTDLTILDFDGFDGISINSDGGGTEVAYMTLQNAEFALSLCSNGCAIRYDRFIQNSYGGIMIHTYGSTMTNIVSSIFENNYYGIYVQATGSYDTTTFINQNIFQNNAYGVGNGDIANPEGVVITSNQFIGNTEAGVFLVGVNWRVVGNNFQGNSIGVSLEEGYYGHSHGNKIYNNNFKSFTYRNAQDNTDCSNAWDGGELYGGNYWSDWNGVGVYTVPGLGGKVDHYPCNSINGWIHHGPGGKEKCIQAGGE
jgi:hypothetical protein